VTAAAIPAANASPGNPGATPDAPAIPGVPNPRLDFKTAFGDDYPDPQDRENHGKTITYLDRLIQETQTDAMARYRQAVLCALYYSSKHYVTWNTRRYEYEEMPLEDGEIRVTYNLIRPIVRSRIQRLLSPKVAFSAIPHTNSMDERDKARTGANWLNSRWRGQKMDDLMQAGMQLAVIGGCCALKSYWNNATGPLRTATLLMPRLGPDGTPVLDQTGTPQYDEMPVDVNGQVVQDEKEAHRYRPGDTGTGLRSVFNVRLNTEARGWSTEEGARWLIDEEMVPVSVARRRWPEYAEKITEHGSLPALTYERMAAGAQTNRPASFPGAPAQQTQPNREKLTLQREYWQFADDDYFPNGRLIVQIGQCIVYDDAFPQNVFAYSPIFDEPGVLTAMGRPSVIDMLSPQDAVNREYTALVQEMFDAGVGQFISWDIPEVPEQITREARAVVKIPMRTALAGKSVSDVFQRMEPARSPSDRWRIVELSERALQNIGAYHEVTRGTVPPGVESGVAIEQLVAQEQGQLALSFRALENTILHWGRVQLAIARWGYGEDEERFIAVERPDLGFQVEGVKGAGLPDPETIDLVLDNFKPTSEAENQAEIKWAYENGLIDGRAALDALDMGRGLNAVFTSQTRHYARARMENLKIQRGEYVLQPSAVPGGPDELFNIDGTPFFLPTHDDHAVHVVVLQELILDDMQPAEVRAVAQAHGALHQQAIMMIAQQQAAAAAQQSQQPPQGQPDQPPGGGVDAPSTPTP
jgi:hypothetical protein